MYTKQTNLNTHTHSCKHTANFEATDLSLWDRHTAEKTVLKSRQSDLEMTDASVILSVSLFNVLQQVIIIRTRLSEPHTCAHTHTHTHTHTHRYTQQLTMHCCLRSVAVCVCVCVCVFRLHCTVPVTCTEEPFVLQSQPVETRWRWRGEKLESRIKERKDETAWNEGEEKDGNKYSIYIIYLSKEKLHITAQKTWYFRYNIVLVSEHSISREKKGKNKRKERQRVRETSVIIMRETSYFCYMGKKKLYCKAAFNALARVRDTSPHLLEGSTNFYEATYCLMGLCQSTAQPYPWKIVLLKVAL